MSYGAVIGASYTGGNNAIRVMDNDGASLLNIVSTSVLAVAADTTAFYAAVGSSIKKYDYAGNELWSQSHGATIRAVAVDSSGNVYIGGDRTSSKTHRKYNSAGTEQWYADHGDTVYGIAVDSNGNVYIGGWSVSGNAFRKYNSSGTLQWSKGYGGNTIYAVAVDSSDYAYSAGQRYLSKTHHKYNSSGTLQWSADHGTSVLGMAVDSSGNVYIGGGRTSSITHRKYNSSGTLQWSKDHGAQVQSVAVEPDGKVWIAGQRTSSITHRKLDSAGDVIWSSDHGDTVNGIALYIESTTRVSGGLPVAISPGLPFPSFVHFSPAMALRVTLRNPTATPAPTPPEYATRYRLYVTGQPTLIEWPLASWQCRRRLGDSTWLTLTIPITSMSGATMLALLMPLQTQLVIYAGDALGQWGEMLRAWLTEMSITRSPGQAMIQLTGRIVPVTATRQTRVLFGVESINIDAAGRRIVRCAVNPLIRPNDTVTYGAISFVVQAASYRISPYGAAMEITELG